MRMLALSAVVAGLMASAAVAQTGAKTVPFATRLDGARTAFRVDEAGLHGTGAEVLGRAVAGARHVLLGEDHLSREIPQFATQICRLMAPGGLDAFAIEIGPEAARVVNDNLRRTDRRAQIAAYMTAHPDAMAFQNGVDESDMAARCAGLAGPNFHIWGLDQEFFGATGPLIAGMLAARPGPVARAAIEKLAAFDRAASLAARSSGSVGDLLIYKASDRQMEEVRSAIARDGGARAKALFDALNETRQIFLGQNTDGFASNGQRARLMKRTLVQYFDTAPATARILFKFGDVHMAKGINGLGQRDVGNFVAERVEGEGATSLHIAVYGAKGIHALYGGFGRQARHEPFVMTDDADYAWLSEALTLRDRAGAGGDWMLVDLRALRGGGRADMSARWRQATQQYDLLVVAPELTPSTLLGAEQR